MMGSPRAGQNPIALAVFDGHDHIGDLQASCFVGHSLTRWRRRYLRQAEWIVVTEGSCLLGVAAYQRVQSDVRLVLEFLIDPALGQRQVSMVTDMLASAVEAMALGDSVHCLMFMLCSDVPREPFDRRGYRAVVLDPSLAWLQKTLDQTSCVHACSQYLQ